MAFPISVTGRVAIPKEQCRFPDAETNVIRIQELLKTARVTEQKRDGGSVVFRLSIFRMFASWSWDVMLPFDSGQIDVSDEGTEIVASYSAGTIRLLICVTLMMVGGFVFLLSHEDRHFVATNHVWGFVVLWLWLFCGNYITAAIRFPRWLRRGLTQEEHN